MISSLGIVQNADRLARQHLVHFWAGSIVHEGRTVPHGYQSDADEPVDALEEGDLVGRHDLEALGGRIAREKGELFARADEDPILRCRSCPSSLWCANAFEGRCGGDE